VRIAGHNFTTIETMIIGLIVVLVGIIWIAGKQMAAERKKFMDDCMRDHKEYECTIMWKEAQPDTQTIIVPSYR